MLEKLKETFFSIGPIVLIVLLLSVTVVPISFAQVISFLISASFTIVGLSFFLLGADIGIVPIGEKAGSALISKKNLALLLVISFLIGFIITIAEPDVQVLASQICSVNSSINSMFLVMLIAIGVAFFVCVGLLRTILQVPIKIFYFLGYILIFTLAFLAPKEFFAISFDAGGATTGPMTVPFIIALGMGVASVKSNKNADSKADNFGLTGMASMGPILAVLVMGLFANSTSASAVTEQTLATVVANETTLRSELIKLVSSISHAFFDVLKALLPLVGLFIFFLLFLFKMTAFQIIRISVGLFYSFFGLVLFLTGVNSGFIPTGLQIGTTLASSHSWLLIILGFLIGAIVVCAEPAVWVLTKQVEEISGGTIKRQVLLGSLSIGVAVAVGLAIIRVLYPFPIFYLLIPAFSIALLLLFFCPTMFSAIAFDSGGVASGPMTASFVLSLALGASSATGGDPMMDGFGVIALVATAPLIAIQVLGLIFAKRSRQK